MGVASAPTEALNACVEVAARPRIAAWMRWMAFFAPASSSSASSDIAATERRAGERSREARGRRRVKSARAQPPRVGLVLGIES